jgi:hypothetical protein
MVYVCAVSIVVTGVFLFVPVAMRLVMVGVRLTVSLVSATVSSANLVPHLVPGVSDMPIVPGMISRLIMPRLFTLFRVILFFHPILFHLGFSFVSPQHPSAPIIGKTLFLHQLDPPRQSGQRAKILGQIGQVLVIHPPARHVIAHRLTVGMPAFNHDQAKGLEIVAAMLGLLTKDHARPP